MYPPGDRGAHAERVIDLDVAPQSPAARRSSPAAPPLTRPIAAAAVLLVLLMLGGGVAFRPNLTRLPAVSGLPAGAFVLAAEALFTTTPGVEGGSPPGIQRYALPDGSRQWAADVPHSIRRLQLNTSGDVLVASSGEGPQLLFLDAATGRTRWRSTAPNTAMMALTDTRVLLISNDTGGSALLRLVDLHGGETVWSRRIPSAARVDTDSSAVGPATRILVVGADGRASVLGFTDGAELDTADLGVQLLPFENDGRSDHADVTAVGDRVYVARRLRGETSLASYAIDGLRMLWRVGGRPVGQLTGCGEFVCVTGEQALTVIDQRDGSVRWADPRWRFGLPYPVPQGRPDRPRILALGRQDDREAALVDAASGRMLQPLGHSRYVGRLMLRSDTRVPDRIWVSAPGPGGDLQLVGAVDDAGPYGCSAEGRYLACPTSGGVTAVWRVPA